MIAAGQCTPQPLDRHMGLLKETSRVSDGGVNNASHTTSSRSSQISTSHDLSLAALSPSEHPRKVAPNIQTPSEHVLNSLLSYDDTMHETASRHDSSHSPKDSEHQNKGDEVACPSPPPTYNPYRVSDMQGSPTNTSDHNLYNDDSLVIDYPRDLPTQIRADGEERPHSGSSFGMSEHSKVEPLDSGHVRQVSADLPVSSRDIMTVLRKMRRFRDQTADQRGRVDDARDTAFEKLRAVGVANKKMHEALRAAVGKPGTLVGDSITQLSKRARICTKQANAATDMLEKEERRLRGLEYKSERQEGKLFAHLQNLERRAPPPHEDRSDASLDDDEPPEADSESVTTEDLDPLVTKYNDAVGYIHIMRERLNEFEIAHRQKVVARGDADDLVLAQDHPDAEPKDDTFGGSALDTGPERDFLDAYFKQRTAMVEELLQTTANARSLRAQCIEAGLPFEEDSQLPNALEAAIRFNFTGPIGRMYALQHEGPHHGIEPLQLARVPFVHAQDRVEHWIDDLGHFHQKELVNHVSDKSEECTFKLYYRQPTRGGLGSEYLLTSATDYPLSYPVDDTDDDALLPVLKMDKATAPWATWSGECRQGEPPASVPALYSDSTDHFGYLDHVIPQKTRSLDLS